MEVYDKFVGEMNEWMKKHIFHHYGCFTMCLYSMLYQYFTCVSPEIARKKKMSHFFKGLSNVTFTQYGLVQCDVNLYNNWKLKK